MGKCWKAALVLAVLVSAGCEFPRDAGGTLERVQREGVLRVGYSLRPPWVEDAGRPAGIEPRLIEAFAARQGARIEWIPGAESSLVEALRDRRIDVVIGGFELNSPLADRAATTQVFLRTSIIIAGPDERLAAGFDPKGEAIAHARLRPDIAALVAGKRARPQAVTDLRGKVAAVHDVEARGLGLTPTGIRLGTTEQVMLVAQGESRLLYQLDLFLADPSTQAAFASGAAPPGSGQ